jgi:putative nucleotidyltransferase with HDIG domain
MDPMDKGFDNLEEMRQHISTLEMINEGLRQSFEELTALYRLSETIASAHTLSRVLSLLMDLSKEILDWEAGVLLLYDERSQLLTMQLKRNLTPEMESRVQAQMREGLLLWALKEGRTIVLPDTGAGSWTRSLPGDGVAKSFITVPLIAHQKPIGLLNLVSFTGEGAFTQRDLSLLSILANQAAISIENAKLYEKIRRDYGDVVEGLAQAIDARDHYTQMHASRVSTYAVLIAEALRLPAADVEDIRFGALLHDVGKIGISDTILNKPGRLTEEEFQVMKAHPVLGAAIVRKIDSLSHLVPLVLYHHERFDGKGYPEGLQGREIPLGARILNVADSYETMTSDRVYRAGMSFEAGLEEVRRNIGGQFDPDVAEALFKVYPVIKERFTPLRVSKPGEGA